MKKLVFLAASLIYAVTASAQCGYYQNLKEGLVFEMESFNQRDKKQGRVLNKVMELNESGNGFEATIHSVIYDNKDKEAHSGDYQMICEDGVMKVDMRRFIPEDAMKGIEDAEIEVKGDYLAIPSNLSVGQELPDGSMQMTISAGQGMMNMNTNVHIKDRKVEGKESVTTPAGTFECFKITYTLETATKMMGMNMAKAFKQVDWINERVGVVKNATYDDKGNLSSYTVLTRFE